MNEKAGIYYTTKKDGTPYYRVSITYKGKHISLGSFMNESDASAAYSEAWQILSDNTLTPTEYTPKVLAFEKCVTLMNFRDHNLYFKTPIYVMSHFFFYYYNKDTVFTFDIDDLFYYANHKIMKRGRHLFVADYGMQVNILNRYGIRNFAVENRDYYFSNGDSNDFRYSNIVCLNPYFGVQQIKSDTGLFRYRVKIHINGDYIVGTYDNLTTAAIAYNKATDIVKKQGINKKYETNYIEGLSAKDYAEIYTNCSISEKLLHLTK